MPTRRRYAAAQQRTRMAPVRRKRVWARTRHTVLDGTNICSIEDLLADFRSDLGVTKNVPGTTIGGIVGRIVWEPSAVAAGQLDELTMGIIVAPDTVENVDIEAGSGAHQHLDWMWMLRTGWGGNSAGGIPMYVDLQIRAKRKLDEIGQTLWFSYCPGMGTPRTVDMSLQLSTLLLLP